jgi:hypothetical protein
MTLMSLSRAQLLAAPLIIDLCVLAELFTRIKVCVCMCACVRVVFTPVSCQYRDASDPNSAFESFHPVLSVLAYLLKASSAHCARFCVRSVECSGARGTAWHACRQCTDEAAAVHHQHTVCGGGSATWCVVMLLNLGKGGACVLGCHLSGHNVNDEKKIKVR